MKKKLRFEKVTFVRTSDVEEDKRKGVSASQKRGPAPLSEAVRAKIKTSSTPSHLTGPLTRVKLTEVQKHQTRT